MKLRPASIRLRLTLWHTLVLAFIVIVFSLTIFFFVKEHAYRQLNHDLREDLAALTQVVEHEPDDVREVEPTSSPKIFQVVRGTEVYYQSPAFEKAGLPVISRPGRERHRTYRTSTGHEIRVMSTATSNGFVVSLGEDEAPVRRTIEGLVIILVSALPLALILAAVGGYVLAGRLLRPVAAMTERADRISADNLSERLPVKNPDDELGKLALVFNRTLARLEAAFDRLRSFTADASHELRTPLTAIQSVGEVALEENLKADDYRDRIGSMLEETARLTRLVESLLLLTRADAGKIAVRRTEQDLAAIVEKAVDDMRVVAEEKNLGVVTDIPAHTVGFVDADTLRQALLNILDNAIKYSRPGGAVGVRVRDEGGETRIEVSDSGPGIPPEQREKIFERFYRVEKDRPRDVGGAGLGLAIAKWAVEANGGRIEVAGGSEGGSVFRIVLPRSGPANDSGGPKERDSNRNGLTQ